MEPSDFGNVAEERPAIPPTTREAEDESKPMISNCPVATHCENADPEHCDSSVGDSSVLIEEQEDLRQGLPGQAQEGKNPVALKQVNADISAFELSFQALLKTLRCFQEEHLFNSSSNSRNEDELSIQAREGHNLETEEEEQLEAPSAMKNQPIIQTVQTTCKEVREYPSHRTTVSSHGNRRHMVRTNTSISTASRLLSHVCSKEERMLMLAMGRGASMEPDEHEHPLIEDKLPAKSPLVKALNRILHHPGFELSMGMAVCTNAIFIGWEVDYMTARPESTVPPLYFTVISYCYNGTFLMELVLRLMAGCTSFFWKSQLQVLVWNYLDIIIVVSSLVEVGLDILTFNGAENGHVSMSNLRIIRMVRVFRLIRLLRIARFVRFVRALRSEKEDLPVVRSGGHRTAQKQSPNLCPADIPGVFRDYRCCQDPYNKEALVALKAEEQLRLHGYLMEVIKYYAVKYAMVFGPIAAGFTVERQCTNELSLRNPHQLLGSGIASPLGPGYAHLALGR